MRIQQEAAKPKSLGSKLVLGAAGAAAATIVATAGIVGAAPADKPTKEWCQAQGYKNYGQCVKDWAQNRHGYGGGNNNHGNVSVNVSGNGNVFERIVINIYNFFG